MATMLAPSGSGKSSLTDTLLRLKEPVDAAGVPVPEFSSVLERLLGLVDPVIELSKVNALKLAFCPDGATEEVSGVQMAMWQSLLLTCA